VLVGGAGYDPREDAPQTYIPLRTPQEDFVFSVALDPDPRTGRVYIGAPDLSEIPQRTGF